MRDRERHKRARAADSAESVAPGPAAPAAGSESPPLPEAQGDGAEADVAGGQSEPGTGTETGGRDATAPAANDGGQSPVVDEIAQQLSEQRDKYLRLAAEYDNFRKRVTRERIESGARAQAELISRLIDALDDLARFAHVDPATTDAQTLHRGIELVEQKMMKTLGAAGLEVVNPVDQSFDPNLHEAVATEPALSSEDDHTVARVLQPGYRFNGQLLRPARVIVKQWTG